MDTWLNTVVAGRYDAFTADPERAIPGEEARKRLLSPHILAEDERAAVREGLAQLRESKLAS